MLLGHRGGNYAGIGRIVILIEQVSKDWGVSS